MLKPMLPTLAYDIPKGSEWKYEVKYDGFRAMLTCNEEFLLTSRNGKPLLQKFPELIDFLAENKTSLSPFLPLILDGELVLLENSFKADFAALQMRGRMKHEGRIAEAAKKRPCRLLVFDILMISGESLASHSYASRRKVLENLFLDCGLPSAPDPSNPAILQLIPSHYNLDDLWDEIVLFDGEGLVAKKTNSLWEEGKRSDSWVKVKNWKFVSCFVTAYEKSNGYFYVSVYRDEQIQGIGLVLFGFQPEEKKALHQIIKQNSTREDKEYIYVKPAICLDVKYLDLYEGQIREPHFHQFRFDLTPVACTYDDLLFRKKNLPSDLVVTHPEKTLWQEPLIRKIDYIDYLREISPYFLPFMKNRLLTIIRYPHGTMGESFYQKNVPDYAPAYIETSRAEGIEYIVCNNLKSLLWLGNQIALEFHVPFQTIGNTCPDEIVIDLDPPSKEHLSLAIKAAQIIKEVLDEMKLLSFIKTSGSKGLQIYLPLPANTYSYEDTRLFTKFIANYLVSVDPSSFTTERLKKNRGSRLYIDYLQHAEGKTIISPYSPRGREIATVAAPLFWEEIAKGFTIEEYTVESILPRVKKNGCPFKDYFKAKDNQDFAPVLDFLKTKT